MAENSDLVQLPSYAKPPVVETILGVQFEQLPKFSNAFLGAFWKTLDTKEWPAPTDAPLLPAQFEGFTGDSRWFGPPQLRVSQNQSSRIQIRNAASDRMLQLQNNRFHYNWLGETGSKYPRFETIVAEFEPNLRRVFEFIEGSDIGIVSANQWEITYINQIPKGTVWNSPADWNFFRPLGSIGAIKNGLHCEAFGGDWQFEIPQKKGRLHINWQLAKKSQNAPPEEEFIQLTLTARGPTRPGYDKYKPILDGLNLGRETIVVTFRELMTSKANNFWGLQ